MRFIFRSLVAYCILILPTVAGEPAAMDKNYKLDPTQLISLAQGYGAGIASDRITVEGLPVRFMYREGPDHSGDSGWRFLSGAESDEYMADGRNHGVYDVNTIANYDRSIIPYLSSPVGSVFEKVPGEKEFQAVTDWQP
jgi:hypothetical protein